MARLLRIGLNIPPVDPFWVEACEAAYEGAQQLGVELIPIYASYPYMAPRSDEEEVVLVEEVLGQDLDAIIGWDFSERLAYRLLDGGVPIISHGEEFPVHHPLMVVREALYPSALLLGDYIANRLGGRGHVLVVGGRYGNPASDDGQKRIDGFRDVFKAYPQIHWEHIPSHWSYEKAYSQICTALEAISSPVNAILGLSDTLALAGREAAHVSGHLKPETYIAGINGDTPALAAIADGRFTATVETSATDLGQQMIDLAYKAAQHLPHPARFNFRRTRLVTAENVIDVAAQKLMDIANLPNRLVGVQHYEEQQRLAQLEVSLEISRQIGSILDRGQLSHEIARLICARYGYDYAQIFL